MKKIQSFGFIAFLCCCLLPITATANITLPAVFSNNMVLQQKSEITLWGWAKAMEQVTIRAGWMDQDVKLTVPNHGTWKVTLQTPAAGGPYTITLKGHNEITLNNVLIGEVWLVSGQSNMEWTPAMGINNAEAEISKADYPGIRFFTMNHGTSLNPQELGSGEWTVCTPQSMKNFSAIAYLFARKLYEQLGVPVGMINSSWGGTPAEAWTPASVIQGNEALKQAAVLQKPVPWGPVEPGVIYNFMIAPLVPYRIAGVLWYQGEANTVNATSYKALLTALVGSWRKVWGYEFPFYYAQIAPYTYGKNTDGVMVRDQQRRALDIPNSGMVVLSDIGDTTNIHPKNKQDAALRFANLALNRTYKTITIEDCGPLYKSITVEKDKAIVSFDHADGLHATGKKLICFEIAGEDRVYYPADAVIKGQQVVVSSKNVKVPVAVRFAWNNRATPNLFNGANLPASCFTTE
jgi:sialate O-acetylesterase